MEIRLYEPADLPLLAARDDADIARAHAALQERGDGEFLVAWEGPAPLGWAVIHLAGIIGQAGRERFPDGVEIIHLQVQPESRGRGVGTAIIATAEQRLRNAGVPLASLAVGDNPDAARLYERLGYRPTGVVDRIEYRWRDGDGTWHDETETSELLVKPLG